MNLVKQIVDELSGESLDRLASLLGTDAESISAAVAAGVPSLLGGFAAMASREEGARRLAGTLNNIDTAAFGDFAQLLHDDASGLMKQGSNLLHSLLGEERVAGLAGAVGHYSDLGGNTSKNLLAYLLPFVLAKIARYWKSKGGTPQALMNLFTEQRSNIAGAIPAGFSLGQVPGMADAASQVAGAARQTSGSATGWAIPLVLLVAAGVFVWQWMQPVPAADQAADRGAAADETTLMKPVVPDTTADMPATADVREQLNGMFDSFNSALADISDAASAEAAAPQLEAVNQRIDSISKSLDMLPEARRGELQPWIDDQLSGLKAKIDEILAMPGLSDRVHSLIQQIVAKLESLRGTPTTS